ncbi:hypothetical protein [Stenotrophomonas sp. NRRL B-14846]|uniref:hypothetical protein n=1 Tax=Stenotrophomonas sp. NRRL B-14846 TaxID=3162882 RepID=UPI003D2E8DFA
MDYKSSRWSLELPNGDRIEVDFDVVLSDGHSLASPKHIAVCETFKSWICIQTHVDVTGGSAPASLTIANSVREVLQLIDFFLLNAEDFKLCEYGLEAVTKEDLVKAIHQISSEEHIGSSLYNWPIVLAAFLREKISAPTFVADETLDSTPSLSTVLLDQDSWTLGLSTEEVIMARAWLQQNGFISSPTIYGIPRLQVGALFAAVYPNLLRRKRTLQRLDEFRLHTDIGGDVELARAPIYSDTDDGILKRRVSKYTGKLGQLLLLNDAGFNTPSPSAMIDLAEHQPAGPYRPSGRFATIPYPVVLFYLRHALEFTLTYGEDLLNAYTRLITAAKARGMRASRYIDRVGIKHVLPQSLLQLGVTRWRIAPTGREKISVAEFTSKLRSNASLYELLRIYFASLQIVIGVLAARRQAELQALYPQNCVGADGTSLRFKQGKSGMGDRREVVERPLPPIAIRLIEQVRKFQDSLIAEGIVSDYFPLLKTPGMNGSTSSRSFTAAAHRGLDLFADYFQAPTDEQGRRYYLRQHCFRRAFAMLFFWSSGLGNLDVLRWFLGHTDVEHVYHYITEATPGTVLRSVKSQFIVETTFDNASAYPAFIDLIEEKYATRDVSVLAKDELVAYLDYLQEDDRVSIEPDFATSEDGTSYEVVFLVRRK